MNKVILEGLLTKVPASRTETFMAFTIAVDKPFTKEGGNETADFISCVDFGKKAEIVEHYARKGLKVKLTGRIQPQIYVYKSGKTLYTIDIVVENIELAESNNV